MFLFIFIVLIPLWFDRPNRVDCPGADFYTPQSRTDGAMMDPTAINTRPTFDTEVKSSDFQSDTPWLMSTRGMTGEYWDLTVLFLVIALIILLQTDFSCTKNVYSSNLVC